LTDAQVGELERLAKLKEECCAPLPIAAATSNDK
jgi:hypothetical protein